MANMKVSKEDKAVSCLKYRGGNKYTAGQAMAIVALVFVMSALPVISGSLYAADKRNQPIKISESKTHLSEHELRIWNDPKFQERFANSYIAETEIEPRVTVDEREILQEVLELFSNDQLDEAAKILKEERNEAASAVFDFMLANIYFQQNQLDEAAEIYQIAVDKYPKFRRAWKNLGLIYVRQNNYEEAIPALSEVISLGGGDAITYGFLGFSYASVGNSISAESAYRMAIMLDPFTLDWKMGLARSFFKQGRFADAVALCGQLIEEQPDRSDLWLLQANAYIGLDKPLKAAEIYELVDQMGKSTPASLNMLGDIYVNEQLYEMAVTSYIRAMEEDPEADVVRQIRSAKVIAARGANEQVQRLIKKIKEIKGAKLTTEQRKDMLKLRARLAVASGSGEEEAKVLEEIVEIDPLDGEALLLLGQHCERKGDFEKAVFYYERAAAIEDFEADALVRHGQLLVKKGKYDDAASKLKRAQQIKPRENVQKYLEQVERVAKTR
jgi:tetratricopeptide (TPR) repeat protein